MTKEEAASDLLKRSLMPGDASPASVTAKLSSESSSSCTRTTAE